MARHYWQRVYKTYMKSQNEFSERLKSHLESWAIDLDRFRNDGKHAWVLAPALAELNYFGGEEWGALLAGKLHQWSHALNSRQAFAANLFGPARFSPKVAKGLWKTLPVSPRYPNPGVVILHFSTPLSGSDQRKALISINKSVK